MRTSERVVMPLLTAVVIVIAVGLGIQNYELKAGHKRVTVQDQSKQAYLNQLYDKSIPMAKRHKIWQEMKKDFPVLTVMGLQSALRDRGYYKGKIDGKCGKATRKAWDKAICDQFAATAFRPAYYRE